MYACLHVHVHVLYLTHVYLFPYQYIDVCVHYVPVYIANMFFLAFFVVYRILLVFSAETHSGWNRLIISC